jgi:hypothetical protein
VRPDADFSTVFTWVFIAAGTCLAVALLCLAGIEERPLRGPAPAPPGSREAAPIAAE